MSAAQGEARPVIEPRPVIELHDARKTYRSGEIEFEALRGIDCQIYEGEYVAIVGPSGSGKSTLMNILGCLDVLTTGSYMLAGEDVESLDENALATVRNRRIGFVFQQFNLLPSLTALANVELPLVYARVAPSERKRRALEALDRVGLADKAPNRPGELSGGQQQRVAIARAIVGERRLILADEPTGALDTDTGEEILRLLRARCDAGAAGVMVTHEARHAAWADRVVFLRDGVVVDETGADEPELLLEETR